MIQLIRSHPPESLEYCQISGERDLVVIYRGRVGKYGASRQEIPAKSESERNAAVQAALSSARNDGFREVLLSDYSDLVFQYFLPQWDVVELLEFRHLIEIHVGMCIDRLGSGFCDGGDIGNGKINIWCKALEVDNSVSAVLDELEELNMVDGLVVAARVADEWRVVYPDDWLDPFSV